MADGGEARPRKRGRWDNDGPAETPANGANGVTVSSTAPTAPAPTANATDAVERARKLAAKKDELKARLEALKAQRAAAGSAGAQQAAGRPMPGGAVAALMGSLTAARPATAAPQQQQQKQLRPAPLRLDAEGREIDEHGNVIERRESVSSLKINQRKPTARIPSPEPEPAVDPSQFLDPDMHVSRGGDRRRRAAFRFVDPGKLQKQAQIGRLRAEYGDEAVRQLRIREAEERKAAAQQTVDANLIPLGARPTTQPEAVPMEPPPEIEWWDVRICVEGATYDAIAASSSLDDVLRRDRFTDLVQHPVPIDPPGEMPPPPPRPLMLTKKETKKMRKQRREEREKEKQELIRQGLLEPPPPKVKISNLMRVLGEEAVMDPTAIEQQVVAQMAERAQAHEDRNLARKLTPAERKDKKMARLLGKETPDTPVTVYRVESLAKPNLRFKVDINAEQLHMTGAAIVTDDFCVVIVEGGAKSQKRYKRLMTHRIDWAAVDEDEEEARGPSDPPRKQNGCTVVWEGSVAEPAFQKAGAKPQICRSEAEARKYLADHKVVHYWDLAKAATSAFE